MNEKPETDEDYRNWKRYGTEAQVKRGFFLGFDAGLKHAVKESEKEIVVFASQAPIPEIDSYFVARELITVLSDFKNTQLVIKTHPLEEIQPYQQIVKEMNSDAIVQKDHLYELLAKASVVVTYCSTVGLESMILGKPVIIFMGVGIAPNVYESANAVFKVKNRSQLKKTLHYILSKKHQDIIQKRIKRFVYNVAYKQDGKATERVVQVIKEMLNPKPAKPKRKKNAGKRLPYYLDCDLYSRAKRGL